MMLAALLTLAAAPLPAAPLPACTAAQLSLAFDGEGGAFDGMSHSGSLLVLRNIGAAACTVPGLPVVTFKGADGKPLPITRSVPRGMHPGPVIVPVGVAPGAEVTAPLHWVSGAVYPKSRCLAPAFAAVTIGGATIQTRFAAHICGPVPGAVNFEQPVLRVDPVLGG